MILLTQNNETNQTNQTTNKLKYELIGDNDFTNVKHTILKNRGVKDIDMYLNLNEGCLHNYSLFGNMDAGVKLLKESIEAEKPLYILVD